MNKKGQYYLIAAMVVITIVSALIGTYNYSKSQATVDIDKEGEKLEIESEKLMDHALYNEKEGIKEDFVENYSKYLGEEYEVYYVIGNKSETSAYNGSSGERIKEDEDKNGDRPFEIKDRGSNSNGKGRKEAILEVKTSKDNPAKFSFNLKKKEDLYFVIIKRGYEQIYTFKYG